MLIAGSLLLVLPGPGFGLCPAGIFIAFLAGDDGNAVGEPGKGRTWLERRASRPGTCQQQLTGKPGCFKAAEACLQPWVSIVEDAVSCPRGVAKATEPRC